MFLIATTISTFSYFCFTKVIMELCHHLPIIHLVGILLNLTPYHLKKDFYQRTNRFEVVIRYRLNQTGLKLFYFTTTICLLPVCTSQELCMHTRDSRGNVMRREASLKIDILTISVILGIPKLYLRGQKGQTTTTSSCQHHP